MNARAAGLVGLLALATGCGTPRLGAPPSQTVSRLGWLADLAGSCWRQSDFGAEACYWISSPEVLYWFSRNHDGLLGCGRYVLSTHDTTRGSIHTWSDDRVDPPMTFTLSADVLVTDENAESPRGAAKRVSPDSFSIQDRPGSPPLVFQRKGPLSETDPGIPQCLRWEAGRR